MVVLKHILLATLATLAVASPPTNPWGNPDGAAGVAHQGKPGGGATGGMGGSGEHGGWSKDGNGPSGDGDHNSPSGKDDGGNHNHKQRRNWSQPGGAPESPSGGAEHHGMPGADGSGSQDHGHWPPSGGGQSGGSHSGGGQSPGGQAPGGQSSGGQSSGGQSSGGQSAGGQSAGGQSAGGQSAGGQSAGGKSGAGQSGGGQSGYEQSGNGQSGNGQSPGTGSNAGGNTQTQHQSRDEPNHHGFGNGKWNHDGGDERHHRRDALESRDPSPGTELPNDDPGLLQLRKNYFGGANDDDGQHGATWNETEHDGEGNHVERRAAKVYGVYECMNQNFVAPCVWTQLQDNQCYNAKYGQKGSMGPDKGFCCSVYERRDCNDNGWERMDGFIYPGIGDYGNAQFLIQSGMADEGINSVKCHVASSCPKKSSLGYGGTQ
ncbi:hypothetical protein H2200_011123 [Cladophialophora chaetospira]|uniref:Uncharacterized protein n=1 Tax=Cladophialophora chaetospira TaxID=386627 RepID=A0AA38X013_9EURO|nr:hypothetical protein H2200_011123 [Cladophialophora chaetospira]